MTMRKTITFSFLRLTLMAIMGLFVLVSCDPHQFPDTGLTLHLRFDTTWSHSEFATDYSPAIMPTRVVSEVARMRYIIRFYDYTDDAADQVRAPFKEFVFYRDVTDNYDADFEITIAPGRYRVMVWADFAASLNNGSFYHNAADFAEIKLLTPHTGNIDRRDAFRGVAEVNTSQITYDMAPATVDMQRPLAKYEFVSTDLKEFMARENRKLATAANESSRANVDLGKYKVIFLYQGYMPNAYSMFTDRPVDSATGISYDGRLKPLSGSEISLGFDYVMVNHQHTSITVRVALYDDHGTLLSISKPITVPVWRSNHTIVRGRFLMENAGGSVSIDPDYDGEYNLIFNR